jgi:hypothetical protein
VATEFLPAPYSAEVERQWLLSAERITAAVRTTARL